MSADAFELTEHELRTIDAMAERMFPATAESAGASEIGVTPFIAGELAGPWGAGSGLYLDGPFPVPDHAGHGLQHAMTPRDVYRAGLAALDAQCRDDLGAEFCALDAEAQDAMLTRVEKGQVDAFANVSPQLFFSTFYENVLEGLFGDPVHGGNRDMAGWRWLGYPGAQPAHGIDYSRIAHSPAPYRPTPVSVRRGTAR